MGEALSTNQKVRAYVRTVFSVFTGIFAGWAFEARGIEVLMTMLLARLVLEIEGP